MKTKIHTDWMGKGRRAFFAWFLPIIAQFAYSQSSIVYYTFQSGFSKSSGGGSIVTSTLGQSIFGTSGGMGFSIYSGYSSFGKGVLMSVKKSEATIPGDFALYQNYPNPFNPSTTIRYGLPTSSRVSIKIYNILGQQITEIINLEQSAGWYEAVWNAAVASGMYMYRIEAVSTSDPKQRFTQIKKMLAVR